MAQRKPQPSPAAIPRFALYGEAPSDEQEPMHIEEVRSRSRLYHWEIQPHVHRGLHQALWLYAGAADVRLDERKQRIEGPAAILVPPGVVHGFRFEPETDGLVLTLSARSVLEGEARAAGEAFGRAFAAAGILQFAPQDHRVARLDALFRELAAEFALPGGASSPVALWLTRALIWRVAEAAVEIGVGESARNRNHQLFSRFLLLIEDKVLERWPLERYADALSIPTQRLNRLARAESGRSALEIVHERLTREACRRLFYIAAPAEKLAHELGFDDPAYFSRFFKRRTGLTPHRWRAAHRAGG